MRKLLMYAILVCIVAIPIETIAYFVGKNLADKGLLFYPDYLKNYQFYLDNRDPILGWPSKLELGHGEFDQSGSRIVPNYLDTKLPSCVALFGDSFTWGQEVDPEHAYGNVLSGLMQCRISNYGVPGYGTDQAFLRYEKVIKDSAPIVILGYYSDNIIRNVNQNRGFLTNQPIGLKPRYIPENGNLKLVPLPSLSETDYHNLGSNAQKILPYDYFAPGGLSGLHSLKFPYILSSLGSFQHYKLKAKLLGNVTYAQFYDPTHQSQALQVTEAIMKNFANVAISRNQKPIVLLIPDVKEIRQYREKGIFPYDTLSLSLTKSGINVIDAGKELSKQIGNSDPGIYYGKNGSGHLNEEGYKQLANIVYAKIRDFGLEKKP